MPQTSIYPKWHNPKDPGRPSKKISRNEAKARAKKKRKFFKKKLTPEEEAQLAAEQEQLFQKYAPLKSTKSRTSSS